MLLMRLVFALIFISVVAFLVYDYMQSLEVDQIVQECYQEKALNLDTKFGECDQMRIELKKNRTFFK